MNILLTGASGFIGASLARALGAAGHQVRPVSRRHGIDLRDLRRPDDWRPLLADIDVAINCVGIIGESRGQTFSTLHAEAPVALFDACVAAGVRRVIQVSALGADDAAFSDYHLSKRAADDHLRGLDLDWFVLRPSLIYGRGGGSAGLFLRVARLPMIPVIGDGRQTLQPIHISDVVATTLRCLDARPARQTIDIVGRESVGFADWLQSMRRAQGRSQASLLRVPYAMALAVAYAGRRLVPILQPDNVRMLRAGYHADFRGLEAFLGRPARPFSPALFFVDAADAEGVEAP
jgi:uncharacterized protein YbjT (DUF2867 family)